jgi:Na+/melibiose symporter-like transporter
VGALFTIGAISSLLIEPPLSLASDRGSKRFFGGGGMLALALGFLIAGFAGGFVPLAIAFAVIFPATGAAVGLAQAALIESARGEAPRLMAQWTLLSSVGDLLAPLGVSLAVMLALGWGALCWVGAGLWLAIALVTLPQRFPRAAELESTAEDGAEESRGLLAGMRAGTRAALGNRSLLRWMVVLFMATMLDEVFQAFATLYLRDALDMSQAGIGVVLAVGMLGGMLSLVALTRALRRVRGEALLPWLALVALAGVALLLFSHTGWVAALALFLVDVGAVCWYPIAKAAAYASLPGKTGAVLAVLMLTTPAEAALPALVGVIAGHFGIGAAIVALGLAPLGVLLAAPRASPAKSAREDQDG